MAQYIEEHLAEDPSLATLADVARLSPYHFVRAFKQSFGLPPHRYMAAGSAQKVNTFGWSSARAEPEPRNMSANTPTA